MNTNFMEEEITYQDLGDDQGSTYPENNLFNKKQTTPSQGHCSNSEVSPMKKKFTTDFEINIAEQLEKES